MKIVVIGWYDRLNIGDSRIRYSVTKLLQPHFITFLNLWTWPIPFDLLSEQDWILIGGGGLWGGPVMGMIDTVQTWHPKMRPHLGVLGVSAENLPASLGGTKYLLEKSKFFQVRDLETERLFKSVHDPVAIDTFPDLTFLTPYSWKPATSGDGAVSVCLQSNFYLNSAPQDWNYVVEALKGFDLIGVPFNEESDLDRDCLRSIGIKAGSEFDLSDLEAASTAVCARFHGIIFCIQVGRPFTAIACTKKIENFCKEAGLDDWMVAPGDVQGLRRAVLDRKAQHAENTMRLKAIRDRCIFRAEVQRTSIVSALAQYPPNRDTLLRRAIRRVKASI